jgi:hypothetical protein
MAADFLSVALGGLFALGGAYLGPFMQSRQRRDEHAMAQATLKRQKGEELFVLIANVRSNSKGMGLLSFDRDPVETTHPAFEDYRKMFAIVATYFPDQLGFFSDYRKVFEQEIEVIFKEPDRDKRRLAVGKATQTHLVHLCRSVEAGVVSEIRALKG